MQQQDERSVAAQVPVDEGEGQLHQHGRHEREEEREPLPDLVPSRAVRGAEVERCRGLSREQIHRHKDGSGESHPRSLRHLGNPARAAWLLPPPVHHRVPRPAEQPRHLRGSHTRGRRSVWARAAAATAAAAALLRRCGGRAGCFHRQGSYRGEAAGGAVGETLCRQSVSSVK